METQNNEEKIRILTPADFPPLLSEITDPPKKLHIIGEMPPSGFFLAVVGSRRPTPYGKQACEKIIEGLAGYPITIVSGLALGVDTIAHESALRADLKTVAIPGSGLGEQVLYPSVNKNLAKRIVEAGGAVLSEFENDFRATPWSFPQRNRIMAGCSNAVLLIEATLKSGTLITARLATEYNRDVLAVPGSIFSENSTGTNFFLRLGATPIRNSADILDHFGLKNESKNIIDIESMSEDEQTIWQILAAPSEKNELIAKSKLPTERASVALSLLELKGYINESMGMVTRKS